MSDKELVSKKVNRMDAVTRARMERLCLAYEEDLSEMIYAEAAAKLCKLLEAETEGELSATPVQAMGVIKKYDINCMTKEQAYECLQDEVIHLREENKEMKEILREQSVALKELKEVPSSAI